MDNRNTHPKDDSSTCAPGKGCDDGCEGCDTCRPLADLPDHFQCQYRDELLNLYLTLKEQCAAYGYPLLQDLTFSAFEDFALSHSRLG